MSHPPRDPSPRRPAAFLIAIVLALVAACGDGDHNGVAGESQIAASDVRTEVRHLVDTSRVTPPNGSAPGLSERDIATRLWYAPQPLAAPACRGKRCKVVLLAHGFGGRTSRFDALARQLAAVGYLVAAPSFPRTNQDAPGGHLNGLDDLSAQPGDLTFVLDSLAAAAADPQDPLHGRVDTGDSGAVGHSLGGATVVAATRTDCCGDARIAAAALVAPVPQIVEPLIGEAWSGSGPPTLVIGGSVDPIVSPASLAAFYDAILPPRLQLEVSGGNHVDLIENYLAAPDPHLAPTAEALRAFFDTYLGGAADEIAPAFAALEAAGNPVRLDLRKLP
jgi:predicted dienelactone hydrolase